MSAKNRNIASKAFDIYPTPVRLVRTGFDFLFSRYGEQLAQVQHFVEPGAGYGPFCRMASLYLSSSCKLTGIELHPPADTVRFAYDLVHLNFLDWHPPVGSCGFIATNPPFTQAEEFITHSQELLAPDGLMLYLMRVGVLGSKRRREFWREVNLREVWIIRPRPSFQKEGGSDASEYAFFLMDGQRQNCSENVQMRWLDWDDEGTNTVVSEDEVALWDWGYETGE